MNRYLIECINDCKNEFVVAYAPSMYDDNMSKATDLRDYIFKNTNLWLKPTNEKRVVIYHFT